MLGLFVPFRQKKQSLGKEFQRGFFEIIFLFELLFDDLWKKAGNVFTDFFSKTVISSHFHQQITMSRKNIATKN